MSGLDFVGITKRISGQMAVANPVNLLQMSDSLGISIALSAFFKVKRVKLARPPNILGSFWLAFNSWNSVKRRRFFFAGVNRSCELVPATIENL